MYWYDGGEMGRMTHILFKATKTGLSRDRFVLWDVIDAETKVFRVLKDSWRKL